MSLLSSSLINRRLTVIIVGNMRDEIYRKWKMAPFMTEDRALVTKDIREMTEEKFIRRRGSLEVEIEPTRAGRGGTC